MQNEDPHTLSFNLSSSIGSMTRISILFPKDSVVWALYFEDYVLGIEEHGAIISQAMTQETFSHTGTRRVTKTLADYNELILEHTNVPQEEKDKLMSNIKALRIIWFSLPPDTFRLVSACETAKKVWDRLKVSSAMPTEDFVNIRFKGFWGTYKALDEFTLADLPFMNPYDWISLFNIVMNDEKKYEPIVTHLKNMLICYVLEIAKIDVEIALVSQKKPILEPKEHHQDIKKMKL